MSLPSELKKALNSEYRVRLNRPWHAYYYQWPSDERVRRYAGVLGEPNDYKDNEIYFECNGHNLGVCLMRGSIASICWRKGSRKYEYEYAFAKRLGRYLKSRMEREGTKMIQLRVRPDSEWRDWLLGRIGGFSVVQENFDCYLGSRFWGDSSRHGLRTCGLEDSIVFVDSSDMEGDEWRALDDLLDELQEDGWIEEKRLRDQAA